MNKYEYRKEQSTLDEMLLIKKDITSYKNRTGKFPVSLNEVVTSNPLKGSWFKDGWGNEYMYQVTNPVNGHAILTSKGHNTEDISDDIVMVITNTDYDIITEKL